MDEDQADAKRGEQVQVVQESDEASALGDQFAAKADDKCASAESVHIGRRLAEPAYEGFWMRQRAHGVATLLEIPCQRVERGKRRERCSFSAQYPRPEANWLETRPQQKLFFAVTESRFRPGGKD